MPEHQCFNLGRPDFKTRRVDHALEAVRDEEIAFFVHPAQVTGTEKSFAVQIHKSLGGCVRSLPVTTKDLRAAHDDFTLLALRNFF